MLKLTFTGNRVPAHVLRGWRRMPSEMCQRNGSCDKGLTFPGMSALCRVSLQNRSYQIRKLPVIA